MEKKELKCILSIGALLLVVGGIFDLQISHAVYNGESIYGKLFQAFAAFPAVLIASFCAMGIFVTNKKEKTIKSILSSVLSALLTVFLVYTAATMPGWYLKEWKWIGIVLFVFLFAAEYKAALYCKRKNEEEFRKAAKIGLLLIVISFVVYNSIKFIWGRERYRHMIKIGSFAGFSRWFCPHPLASGSDFMSFPSGHSANAAVIIWITLIPRFIETFKGKERVLKVFAYLWIILSMFSRIVIGAHFLSDVTVGASITLIIFYFLCKKIMPVLYWENNEF